MIDIVRNYELPGNLALSEEDIQSFVEYADSDNVHKKMQFLNPTKINTGFQFILDRACRLLLRN